MQSEQRKALDKKIEKLAENDVILAFSGGIDSTLLLMLLSNESKKKQTKLYAITFQTFLHPMGDLEIAKKLAKEMEVSHIVLEVNEMENPKILENPVDRCYFCKQFLFGKLQEIAQEKGITTIVEGSNADDLKVYRPGIRAVREMGVNSPLADCQITKEMVRTYAKELGISIYQRPSTPCLATRLPYDTKITIEKMEQIEKSEAFVKSFGFRNVRVRMYGDTARVEVDQEDLQKAVAYSQQITEKLKDLGFVYVTLDLEGFRQGSMDLVIET